MTRYYLDLPVLDSTDPVSSYRLGSEDIMDLTGRNIGNLAFRHALRFIIDDLHSYAATRYPGFQRAAQAGEVDETIVSCANWLGTRPEDERANLNRAEACEAAQAPITCFGLGVQASSDQTVIELGPNTLRLARVLSERAELLSVRDEATLRTLESAGIKNAVITGCPSNFINGDPELGAKVAKRATALIEAAPTWKDVKCLINEFSGGNPMSGRVLSTKLGMLETTPAHYVLQSPTLLPFCLRESDDIPAAYKSNNPFGNDQARLRSVLRSKCIHFSSINAWMDYSRTCDISLGMRIHGNMVPLQAGVPSILISHDSRTAGLGKTMGIPQISAEEFSDDLAGDPRPVLERIVEGMGRYDARRKMLATTMVEYLAANGVRPHKSILGLAGAMPENV